MGCLASSFSIFSPGQLKVEDSAAKLPSWLHTLYSARYEASEPSPPSPSSTDNPSFEDRIFLNRVLGLSNLYYIDPEDQEILQELREVRLQTVQ